MNATDVAKLVREQIADRWDDTNSHRVNLRGDLVKPFLARAVLHRIQKGKQIETPVEVWIVLAEDHEDGYLIFYDESRNAFGLASRGITSNEPFSICGYYGDFWSAFVGM